MTGIMLCFLFRYIVTLGYSDNLMCTELLNHTFDPQKYSMLKGILNQSSVREKFSKPTIGFIPTGKDEGIFFFHMFYNNQHAIRV